MQIKLVIVVVVVVALGDPPTLRAVPTLCLCRPWQKTGRKAPSKTMKLFSAAFSHLHQGFINGYQTSWCYFNFSWELKQRRRQRQRKRHPKSEFMLFQISSLLLKIKICQMLAIFKKLNSRGLYLTSHKEKENYSCFVFTSFIKGDIRKFHVEVLQWWQRNFQKSLLHVQRCCAVNLNLLLFCRSRCRRCRRCLKVMLHGTIRNDDF